MMQQEGFWYSVGRGFYTCFEGLEWMYDHLSPNKIFIAMGFIAFAIWMYVQAKYNKKAAAEGKLQ